MNWLLLWLIADLIALVLFGAVTWEQRRNQPPTQRLTYLRFARSHRRW